MMNLKPEPYLIVLKKDSIEEQKIHQGSLDVLAHHLVGFAMQIGELSVDQAFDLVTKAYPFQKFTTQ